ncbi:MAG: carboxylesterase family protein [Paludibacteraceae bacterium]|nr:carboxylesterase family protein [Paludibacteraceae bacterium]
MLHFKLSTSKLSNFSTLSTLHSTLIIAFALLTSCSPVSLQTTVEGGAIEGVQLTEQVKAYLGIPYAAAPVGDLRWQAPQPVQPWSGVLATQAFANDPIQLPRYSDMVFRGPAFSEDCLYLNVWTSAKRTTDKQPVLIYFNGGGWIGGSASEYRYDGAAMAATGVVTVTANYREDIFGFFAHPELSAETDYHGSGNYGLMDQAAAIEWVKNNIAAFGGDPNRITIAGESAGSFSVSLLMISPLAKDHIAGAILSSGAHVHPALATPLTQAEQQGQALTQGKSLAQLRAMPADELLQAYALSSMPQVVVDGYVLTADPDSLYINKEQAQVPLLAGWNSLEGYPLDSSYFGLFIADITRNLCTYQFEANQPVYRYRFCRSRDPQLKGAVHSSEIEYAMGNLSTNKVYDWQPADYELSNRFVHYYSNFCKTGNPNGEGLPAWQPLTTTDDPVLQLDILY